MEKQTYTFKKTDSGKLGKAFEMEIKRVLKRKNWNTVSPQGQPDFNYNHKNYDAKQNGTIIKYDSNKQYIKGSNRVIYATHIDYTLESEFLALDENGELVEMQEISVNLLDTQMFVLDRKEFVTFLLDQKNYIKPNKERGYMNIQTMYNYTKDAYHGVKGKVLEAWAYEHEIDDTIIDDILARLI